MKKMKWKKTLAMLLCLALAVSMLSACGGSDADSSDSGTSSSSSGTSSGSQETTEDNGGAASEEAVATKDYFPLDEKKELSIWFYFDNSYVTDPNDLYAIQWLEEQTNVHVKFQTVSPQEAQEKFNLMIASGSYPDILRSCNGYYAGGMEKAVDEGVAVDLTDLIPKYMPTYQSIRTSIPALERDTKTDAGKLVAIWSIAANNTEPQGEMMWCGLTIRRDWLEELGLNAPVTIADWDKTLRAFKENYNCEAPLMIGANGTMIGGQFTTAFGIYPEWYQENGEVKYGPMQDEYREYLELMAGWYADGLIDPNFVTNDANIVGAGEYMGTGRGGASMNIWNFSADTYTTQGYNSDPDFYLEPVASPVLSEGEHAENAFAASNLAKEAHLITTNCKDVELALRWMDMWYEEDVMEVMSYGKEGESYVKNDDGTYSFTDTILNNPDYTSMDALKAIYTPGTSNMGLFNWAYYEPLYAGSESYQAEYVWAQDTQNNMISSSVSMTDEESQEYNSLYTDILTLVREKTVKIIMGSEPIENFDEMRETLESRQGVNRCVELWQAAVDRYNAR